MRRLPQTARDPDMSVEDPIKKAVDSILRQDNDQSEIETRADVLEEVEDADAFRKHLLGVRCLEVCEGGFCRVGGFNGREAAQVTGRGRLRKLDIAGEERRDADRLVDRERCRPRRG